jgi:predicted Zn-dependent peptidase
LARAQRVLIGDYEIKLQHYQTQATQYAMDELYGLGFRSSEQYASKIQAVTVDEVEAAAQKYIRPEAFVIAEIKPCGGQARADLE